MKGMTVFGIILLVVGIAAFAYDSISYTTEEQVVEIGPVEATVQDTESIPLPTVVGAVAAAAGVILIIVGVRRS
jgi:hypothetical protein